MAKGIGRLIQVGINKESQRGTATGTPAYMIAWADLTIDDKDVRAIDDQSRGVIEGSVTESVVKQWSEANIKAPIGDKSFPLVLFSLLGTISTTGTVGTAFTHTITVQEGAQHQSLTILVDDPLGGQDYVHALAVPNTLQISYEREKFLAFSADFMAKTGSAVSVTGTAVGENRFLPQHLTFRQALTQATLGTGTAVSLKSATLKISQNIESDDVLGNVSPIDFLNKNFMIEGDVEAIWQNESDFKTNSLTGTARAVRFDLVNTAVSIGTVTPTNPQLRIDLHSVIFQPVTREIKLNDLVMQKLSFRAHYSVTDSKMVTVTAVNQSSFY